MAGRTNLVTLDKQGNLLFWIVDKLQNQIALTLQNTIQNDPGGVGFSLLDPGKIAIGEVPCCRRGHNPGQE